MNDHKLIYLNGNDLTIEDVINISENGYKVDFPQEIKKDIKKTRKGLEKQLIEHPEIQIYGTNVGCGDLKDTVITPEAFETYQTKYIKAHNCGTGDPLPIEVSRAIVVIRLNSFAKGLSAVRMETCQLMIDMLNAGLSPWVLEEGSVGASGDLIPLAMIGAVLIGLPEAKAYYKGELLNAPEAFKRAGLKPTKLGAKEAMGLTNGSNFISALAVYAIRDAENLLKNASISASLSLEAIRGEKNAFSELINNNRPHKGQMLIAGHIRNLINNSKRTTEEAQKVAYPNQIPETVKERVQDRYSFRAVPQVHGPVFEALEKLRDVVTIEINSATDNPLFFVDESGYFQAKSGANFHGQPLATVIDYAKLSLTSLGLITDKRTFSLLDKYLNYGLPADLAVDHNSGDTGLMLTQYAGAARAAESRVLSTPASVTSVSTSANQEDFVSMGSIGAVHLKKVIYNTQIIVGIEFLCALRALQMSYDNLPENLRALGEGTDKVYKFLCEKFPAVSEDQYMRLDIEKAVGFVKSGELVDLVGDLLK
ncbi:MAG: aromatic amino acid lyase [Bacteroidetes bacterium]|nr:aromatic amino acid lyase [Bacteroidota bacterium]